MKYVWIITAQYYGEFHSIYIGVAANKKEAKKIVDEYESEAIKKHRILIDNRNTYATEIYTAKRVMI